MIKEVNEAAYIRIIEILDYTNAKIVLPGGYSAVAVETVSNSNNKFEGTLLYIPGVRFNELKNSFSDSEY